MSRNNAHDTRPEQLEADRAELHCSFVQIDGVRTAVYISETINTRRKTILLVHGLGGSYAGMIPLGQVLAKTCNVIYVDLPGHGASDLPVDQTDLGGIDSWILHLLDGGMIGDVRVDQVVAHSFGCYIAAKSYAAHPVPTTFLMPVEHVSRSYTISARLAYLFRALIIPPYNIRWWSTFRGFVLSHHRTAKTWHILQFIARTTQPSRAQLRYQLRIATQLPRYEVPDDSKCTVVFGTFDTMSRVGLAVLSTRLKQTKIITVESGHMAPIEQAYDIAQVFDRIQR